MTKDKKWTTAERNLLTPLEMKRLWNTHGHHRDGGGLFLEIDDQGRRWVYRKQYEGKRNTFGLGSAVDVSLADARKARDEYLTKLRRGASPIEEKQQRRDEHKRVAVPTFEAAARTVYEQRRKSWSNGKHQAQWITSLATFAFPAIGDMPVDEIGTDDVLRVLSPIWHVKHETARRVRQRIEIVLDWAKAAKLRTGDNPVELLGDALGKQRRRDVHFAALPYPEVAEFMAKLRGGEAMAPTKQAFEFMILTAARTREVRYAEWSEIDLVSKTWTIAAEKMKSRKPHVVPLSDRALEILAVAAGLTGERQGLIFRDGGTGGKLSENRLLNAREAIGYGSRCTPHGFRSSFRDWASETTSFPSEAVEMALAHTIRSKVEAAYRRGDLLEKRRQLMAAWASHVGERKGANVVPLVRPA